MCEYNRWRVSGSVWPLCVPNVGVYESHLSYRRGKLMSNDVDIVISHSNYTKGKDIMPGLCKRLTAQLYRKGWHLTLCRWGTSSLVSCLLQAL